MDDQFAGMIKEALYKPWYIFAVIIIMTISMELLRRTLDSKSKNILPDFEGLVQARNILTPDEMQFFKHLSQILSLDFYVFPQIALSALLTHKGKNGHKCRPHFNTKRADFVICDSLMKTVCVIELEETSQTGDKDESRAKILNCAGIPVLRYNVHRKPPPEIIKADVYSL